MKEAIEFVKECREQDINIEVRNTTLSLSKRFEPGNTEQYCVVEDQMWRMILKVPLKGGSTWGTTSDGVGGYSAIQNGEFRLNKSGNVGKRFLNCVSALISETPAGADQVPCIYTL